MLTLILILTIDNNWFLALAGFFDVPMALVQLKNILCPDWAFRPWDEAVTVVAVSRWRTACLCIGHPEVHISDFVMVSLFPLTYLCASQNFLLLYLQQDVIPGRYCIRKFPGPLRAQAMSSLGVNCYCCLLFLAFFHPYRSSFFLVSSDPSFFFFLLSTCSNFYIPTLGWRFFLTS